MSWGSSSTTRTSGSGGGLAALERHDSSAGGGGGEATSGSVKPKRAPRGSRSVAASAAVRSRDRAYDRETEA